MFDVTKILGPAARSLDALRENGLTDSGMPRLVVFSSRAAGERIEAEDRLRVLESIAAAGIAEVVVAMEHPLENPGLLELGARARTFGLTATLRTSDALDARGIEEIARVGFDRIDLVPGSLAFLPAALQAARDAGAQVGLAIAMSRRAPGDVERLFCTIESERVLHACFAFGNGFVEATQARRFVDAIFRGARALADRFDACRVFTSGNAMDPVFAWLQLESEGCALAYRARRLLEWVGPSLDWGVVEVDLSGNVYVCEQGVALGNARTRALEAIWRADALPLLQARAERVGGRCGPCRFRQCCGGGSVARAYAATEDLFAADPFCYLTDEEIAGAGLP